MANEAMAERWNGEASASWVRRPDRYDRMLIGLGLEALDAADLRPGERVLDVGCGSGQLTRQAASRVGPQGIVVGVDISRQMLGLAESRSSTLPQASFTLADMQTEDLPGGFDVAISRFGVMFFDEPVTAFARIRAALRPGGRLAFVAWCAPERNEWVAVPVAAVLPYIGMPQLPRPGTPGPFAFGDEGYVRSVLGAAGWSDVDVRAVEAPVLVAGGSSVDETLAYYVGDAFEGGLLRVPDGQRRADATAALRQEIAARYGPDGLRLGAAVWIVRATS